MYNSDAFKTAAFEAQMSSDSEAAVLKIQTKYHQYGFAGDATIEQPSKLNVF